MRFGVVALGSVLTFAPAVAWAQDAETPAPPPDQGPPPRLPVAYSARPLTLPRLVLNPVADVYAARGDSTFLDATLGAAFGVTNDFELEAIVAPLQLAPKNSTFGQAQQPGPLLGLTARLFASPVAEGGVHLDGTYLTLPATSGAVVRPAVLFRFHAGTTARIDFGTSVPVTAARGSTTAGVAFPFVVGVDTSPQVHLGFNTGFTAVSLSSINSFAIPFGVFGGYAFAGRDGPVFEIDPFFRLPRLTATLDEFEGGVELAVFFYL